MLSRIKNVLTSRATVSGDDREVDVPYTARSVAEGQVQVVDVREPEEWKGGHVLNAVLIPLGSLAFRKDELDPSLPVITVCRSGKRSLVAVDVLRNAGFPDAKSLAGGMLAWQVAGQPVER